mmetsp:Transcript_104148/g.301290  ORF Transcript_104148/g.301290 Transcript_104148/m.301290 type:complete len:263 (+) Transcript_104148:1466-2254(+)
MAEPAGKIAAVLYWPSPPSMAMSPSSATPLASASAALPHQPTTMECAVLSSTLKSRTLYNGDSMAACKAQPRATDSSWFIVVDKGLPSNASEQTCFTQGTREPPPMISTESISLTGTPAAAQAALTSSKTFTTLFLAGSHIFSNSSRVMLLAKSSSSMRHSTVKGASELAERTFFVFMTASSSLKDDFLLDNGLQPCFFSNCAANSRIKHSSNSRPPTLSDFSQTTVSFPRTNRTTDTEKRECPMEQKATVIGFSGSKSFDR